MSISKAVQGLLAQGTLEFCGKEYKLLADRCMEFKIMPEIVYQRRKRGYSLEKALTNPIRKSTKKNTVI